MALKGQNLNYWGQYQLATAGGKKKKIGPQNFTQYMF